MIDLPTTQVDLIYQLLSIFILFKSVGVSFEGAFSLWVSLSYFSSSSSSFLFFGFPFSLCVISKKNLKTLSSCCFFTAYCLSLFHLARIFQTLSHSFLFPILLFLYSVFIFFFDSDTFLLFFSISASNSLYKISSK